MKAYFMRESDEWQTPPALYDALNAEFAFTDDPCPIGGTDGLVREWGTRCFVNPPYSNIKAFIEKALLELRARRSCCVFGSCANRHAVVS
jgi:hypothetical protein